MVGSKVPCASAIYFATELSKLRDLDEAESRMLEIAVRRTSTGTLRRWTAQDDRALLRMRKAGLRVADIAVTLRRSGDAVYRRVSDLRKAARVR